MVIMIHHCLDRRSCGHIGIRNNRLASQKRLSYLILPLGNSHRLNASRYPCQNYRHFWNDFTMKIRLPRFQTTPPDVERSSKHIWSLQTLVEPIRAKPERQNTDFSTSVNMKWSRFDDLSVRMSLGLILFPFLLGEIETRNMDYRDGAGRKGKSKLSGEERRGVCSAYQRRRGDVLTSAMELMMRMALDHSCFLQASATARNDSLPSLLDAIAGETATTRPSSPATTTNNKVSPAPLLLH